jgi:pimeloyl-ACP methyl ester carboxylesterase
VSQTTRFVFIHGSPGRASDFDGVSTSLAATMNCSFAYLQRNGYPRVKMSEGETIQVDGVQKSDWLVGYSWGALEAVALARKEIAGLILIAPYMIAEKPLSPVAKALLKLPLLSDGMLRLLRPKLQRSFVAKTYSPETASEKYASDVALAMSIRSLRAAALEKDLARPEIAAAVSPSIQSNTETVPCLVLAGANDVVAPTEIHLVPIKAKFPETQTEIIEGKGHALLWSCPDHLARSIREFVETSGPSREVRK